MGRKSNLTPDQWATIGKRMLEGESLRVVGEEFGVSESTIRSHFDRKGQRVSTVQKVAAQMYEAETALRALPTDAQVKVLTLVQRLRNISEALAVAAENSAATAVRLSALANSEVQKVDDAKPLESAESLKTTVFLTKAANEASTIPLNLLSANREAVKRFNDDAPPVEEEITPLRIQEGARRVAFLLHRAAALEKA